MAVEVEIPVKPHTFVDGTPAIGAEVNANFDKIIDESYTTIGHAFNGWFSFPATLEYHATNGFKTTTDVDLTGVIQAGDKITWEHSTTGGDRFVWVSHIDYDDTVANRSYIEVIGDTVLNEGLVADSVGVSRIANPYGWPQDPNFGEVIVRDTTDRILTTGLGSFQSFSQVAITVPRGSWELTYSVPVRITRSTAVILRVRTTLVLDTSLTTQFSTDFDCHTRFGNVSDAGNRHTRGRKLSLSSQSTFRVAILGVSSTGNPDSIGFYGSSEGPSLIRATPAYK